MTHFQRQLDLAKTREDVIFFAKVHIEACNEVIAFLETGRRPARFDHLSQIEHALRQRRENTHKDLRSVVARLTDLEAATDDA